MSKKMSLLLSPGLALLLSLGSGCKAAPEKSVVADAPAGKAAPGQQQTAAPQASGATTAPSAAAPDAAGRQLAPLHLPGAPGAATQPGAPDGPTLSPEKIPAVVARVNGEAIKKSDLLDGAQLLQMQLAQVGQKVSPTADFYRKTLESLIATQLLEQDAKAQGITVPETDVQQAVAARKSQLKFPSDAEYKKALAQAGITENDLLARARQQLTIRKYITTRLAAKATVSDQAVRDFYDKHKEQEMTVPERVHVRHILIAVNPKGPAADRDKARQKAQDILKRLQAGEDFGKLAEELSEDPRSKGRKGDLGWILREQTQTVPAFGAAAFALKQPNDLSPVVESPYGFQIVQLIERKEAGTLPFDEVKDRISQLLKEEELKKVVQTRAQELRAKGKIEVYI